MFFTNHHSNISKSTLKAIQGPKQQLQTYSLTNISDKPSEEDNGIKNVIAEV